MNDDWRRHASCRDFPPERVDAIFFSAVANYEEARRICADCPVRPQCAAHARTHRERYGYWGCSPADRGYGDNGALTGDLKCARCSIMFPRDSRGNWAGRPPKFCSDTCQIAAGEAKRRQERALARLSSTGTETA